MCRRPLLHISADCWCYISDIVDRKWSTQPGWSRPFRLPHGETGVSVPVSILLSLGVLTLSIALIEGGILGLSNALCVWRYATRKDVNELTSTRLGNGGPTWLWIAATRNDYAECPPVAVDSLQMAYKCVYGVCHRTCNYSCTPLFCTPPISVLQ